MYKSMLNKLIFSLATVVLLGLPSFAQEATADLFERKLDINFSNATLQEVCGVLARDYHVPIGLELTSDNFNQLSRTGQIAETGKLSFAGMNIDTSKGNLRDILDAIVRQEPEYMWEIRDGVVNIFPIRSRDEFLVKVLETKIARLDLEEGIDVLLLENLVYDLPEMTKIFTENKVEPMKRAFGRPNSNIDKKLVLRLSNMTLREAFNKIVANTEYKMWMMNTAHAKKKVFEISFDR